MIHATGLKLKIVSVIQSPMVTLGEEPCEDCVNDAADDHGSEAGLKDGGETTAGDDDRMLK